jgi:hypothetical protein
VHFIVTSLVVHAPHIVEHCLRFNPVVKARQVALHFFTCLG